MRRSFGWTILIAFLMVKVCSVSSEASYINVDFLSLTIPASSEGSVLADLNLPRINEPAELTLMPFFLRISFPADSQMNWGMEIYTENRQVFSDGETEDQIYRGLRNRNNINASIPLFWQVYEYDKLVAVNYGTPQSVTSVPGELGLYSNTLRYWGTIYDHADIDRNPTQTENDSTWNKERSLRTIVSVDGLGSFPRQDRALKASPVYVYFGADYRDLVGGQYAGQINLDYFYVPFNFSTGCYVTPNPVKPVLGQKAYFNFYTNSPDSQIKIKIFDPTGFPVVTLYNSRYWDGRNSNHQYVEGGLYLYQIETEGHRISGTVVVVK